MLHHTSYAVGYIRKGTLKRVPYQGKFGKGVKATATIPIAHIIVVYLIILIRPQLQRGLILKRLQIFSILTKYG